VNQVTLVIAAHGVDFVVLAADSRGTVEDQAGTKVAINRYRKIWKINDRVAALIYGDADPAKYLVESFLNSNNVSRLGVTAVARALAKHCRFWLNELPEHPAVRLPGFGFVVSGLDPKGRGKLKPQSYALKSETGFTLGAYDSFALEGKPIVAYYMFAQNYHEDSDQSGLSSLVAQALYDTVMVDGDVGGTIRLAIIDRTGMRWPSPQDVGRMITSWENPPIRPRWPRPGGLTEPPG
jgi:20S proteasome alpha/beta subunit